MKSGNGFKLMKNPAGGYKPHKGARQKASFEKQKVQKGKKYLQVIGVVILTVGNRLNSRIGIC